MQALINGLRGVIRRPALTASIVIPLTLATATSTALFAIADALLWRPLPFPNADRTVTVELPRLEPRRGQLAARVMIGPAAADEFEQSFKTSSLFTDTISAWPGIGGFEPNVVRQTGLQVASVNPRFFERFGLRPLHGRVFSEDDRAIVLGGVGALPVILSHGYWISEFGGNTNLIGRVVTIGERQASIVGVMEPGVKFPGRTDVWTPQGKGVFAAITGFAQLSPHATIEEARTAFPMLDFQSLRDSLRPRGAEAMVFIFAATLALLLLAWVQIGGLMLAGAADRRRDVAVRLSLGADTRRIAGEFAAEAVWFAATALSVSWLAVPFLTTALISLLPDSFTKTQYLDLDWRPYAFAVVITTIGMVMLIAAALRVARGSSPLQLIQRSDSDAASVVRTRRGLLIIQASCTALMLYLAALAGFSYLNVTRFNYGFDAENVVIIEPPQNIPPGVGGAEYTRYFDAHMSRLNAMAERLNKLDGVDIAAPIWDTPIASLHPEFRNEVTRYNRRPIDPIPARIIGAGADIVEALGATVVSGTSFSDPYYRGQSKVVLINETLARQVSPGVSPLGMTIATRFLDARIIGVVRDLVDSTPDVPAAPLIFQPFHARGSGAQFLVVRTKSGGANMLPFLHQAVESEFGRMRPAAMRLLADDVKATMDPWRGQAVVLGLVAALGLPLSIVGLASGMLFFVRARTRDIGIRLALGARPSQARQLVLSYARRIVGIGCVIGVGAGALVGQFMSSQLFGVRPASLLTTIAVSCAIAGAAWVAAYIPARRASQVDPVIALRTE